MSTESGSTGREPKARTGPGSGIVDVTGLAGIVLRDGVVPVLRVDNDLERPTGLVIRAGGRYCVAVAAARVADVKPGALLRAESR